jgi:hypothetical protein
MRNWWTDARRLRAGFNSADRRMAIADVYDRRRAGFLAALETGVTRACKGNGNGLIAAARRRPSRSVLMETFLQLAPLKIEMRQVLPQSVGVIGDLFPFAGTIEQPSGGRGVSVEVRFQTVCSTPPLPIMCQATSHANTVHGHRRTARSRRSRDVKRQESEEARASSASEAR